MTRQCVKQDSSRTVRSCLNFRRRPAFGFGVVDYQHASDVEVDSKQTNQEKPIPWGESLDYYFEEQTCFILILILILINEFKPKDDFYLLVKE